ncbi:MAG TPA: FKBP-type peptidyl-prolyl cis-trans isomerase [archaeon]|nr:FKBP-type peptidyl-prolyl cis-trans isomerase [archaeon]
MDKKSVALIEFTGKEVATQKVFDTTSQKEAEENGFYRENAVFGPIPVIVGHGDVLPGLDDALLEMKEGESRNLKLSAAKGFGERKKELVVIVPLQEFHKRNIKPGPGLVVDLNGQYGKVQTVSGGRVRVDMNSDLAGKEVEYELKVVREITKPEEKAQLITEKFFPLKEKAQTKLQGEDLKVKLPKELAKNVAPFVGAFTKVVREVVPQIKKVEVVEEFDDAAGKQEKSEKKSKK